MKLRTVHETAMFLKHAEKIWNDDERQAFVNWIAVNPDAGSVIPGTGGCRKVRWSAGNVGKRGGSRVIYFLPGDESVVLLIAYAKATIENLPASRLKELREAFERGR